MKLVIVESHNKIKSIKKFLGNDYEVIASGGHIRELSKHGKGYNKDTFEPVWQNTINKYKSNDVDTINHVKTAATKADKIYLATDPDREGEAISWHLYDILTEKQKKKCKRITFNEITENAINNAMLNERDIDLNLVYSQWTRRILDRMVGFNLSNLVKSKLHAISAGRVQSVALLFVVERALEVINFIPDYWWTIETELKDKKNSIKIFLRKITLDIEPFEKSEEEFKFKSEEDASKVLALLGETYKIYEIDPPKKKVSRLYDPFQTDTLLSDSYKKMGWSTTKTTAIAQKLYGGVKLDGVDTSLISYPRTDINRLNPDFIKSIRNYISNVYGNEYVNKNVKEAKTSALTQGAHEGIRPVDITMTPEMVEKKLPNAKDSRDILKLYTLIWTRTVCAFMMPPIYNSIVIRFVNNDQKFYTSYSTLIFDGYNKLPAWEKIKKSKVDLSHLKVGDELKHLNVPEVKKHESKSKGYLNEGSLVKELKESGVGRPSTYGSMVKKVLERDYVQKNKNELIPTEMGYKLVENLTKEFNKYISKKFTAKMETDLDSIADGKQNWREWLTDFESKFMNQLAEAKKNMKKAPYEKTGGKCPKCGGDLVFKENSRDHTRFIGCENFDKKKPEQCTYTESLEKKEKKPFTILDEECPWCSSKLVKRLNKKNEEFIGCSNFPKCRYTGSIGETNRQPDVLLDEKCPKCKSNLVLKHSNRTKEDFKGCSNFPKCRYSSRIKKIVN